MSSEDAARRHRARASERELLEVTQRHRAQLKGAIADAADRVDEILARAQEVAEEIRDEAEREAQRYLAARRLETDQAIEAQQAEAGAAFASLARDLDRIAGPGKSGPDAPTAAPTQPVHEQRRSDRAAALLLAGQLAVMGRDRGEIEAALRTELGVERPAEIVDQILPGEDR